jgi:putative phosphoribosyl transferase
VIVIDDGIATGATARAACLVAKAQGAKRVVLAVPVAVPSAIERMRAAADEVVCLETPEALFAIGQWYADFTQVTDDRVVALLARAHARQPTPAMGSELPGASGGVDEDVTIPVGRARLAGHLTAPESTRNIVLFAHGSGSSRHSPRNRFVADLLHQAGLGTMLFDLLSPDEELDRANVFDVELLAGRLVGATEWLRGWRSCRIGYFGASTGAAAALWAAAEEGADIDAVVSRGGRPDLAWPRLAEVRAPTLLIVGGYDEVVLNLNQSAQNQLTCEHQLSVVPGATHLFEEPGTLRAAAELAREWFVDHMSPLAAARR